jgi:hypothetical protein
MADVICQVRRAGIRPDGKAQLDLKADDGTFDWSWFVSKTEISREILAIALTGITSNKKLEVTLPDPPSSWSEVSACFVLL